MSGLGAFWSQTDAVGKLVAYVLLAMSLISWFLIFWKTAVLLKARSGFGNGRTAFWLQPTLEDGARACATLDVDGGSAVLAQAAIAARTPQGALAAKKSLADRTTAALRDGLSAVGARLNFGQTIIASIGSTAPFVGLFGTVWGIYNALTVIGSGGAFAIEKVSGPVGEALIMTAAGLAVAIPAVLAYNIFGKMIRSLEAELEGFAHDLRALVVAEQDEKLK
jgi:biopolymer transport protein ExbB